MYKITIKINFATILAFFTLGGRSSTSNDTYQVIEKQKDVSDKIDTIWTVLVFRVFNHHLGSFFQNNVLYKNEIWHQHNAKISWSQTMWCNKLIHINNLN